jgi:TRAP-type mannitol/chloroaromatic compound transport system permease small subunit
MRTPPAWLLTTIRLIDSTVGLWSGRLFAWLVIPMLLGLVYEVFARYLFDAPTIWAYDLTYMLYGSHFMLGAAYTLYLGGHIRTDFFYAKWSPARQGLVDALLYLLFFFPGIVFFLIAGFDEAQRSWELREASDVSPWRPPIYPFKAVIPVAALLLIVQGVSEFLKSVYAIMTGHEYAKREEILV